MKVYKKGFTYFICLVSAMGGFLFGYDWVVIGGAKPFYEIYFGISNDSVMQAWAMSTALLGCLLGAIIAGALADKYGRKKLLLISALVFFVSSLATGAVSNIYYFILARFVGGIAIGLAADISPMYIAEVAPSQIRGKLVSLNQLTIVLGILGAQIVNMLIADTVVENSTTNDILNSWNGQMGWRWMFWAVCVPSGFFFLFTFLIPESPRWLVQKGKNELAKKALMKIGNQEYAETEIARYNLSESIHSHASAALKELFSPKIRKILLIGIIIAMFQQWSGTNIIFNYAQEIFQSAGYGISDVLFNIVITGAAFLIFTFVAIFTVELIGRKMLMLIGAAGLTVVYAILSICYFYNVTGIFIIVLVIFAIGFYAMSLGPITWVLLSEIFPNNVRGVAMATCTAALWIASFLLTYTFPFLYNNLGIGGAFGLYSLICAAGLIFILKRVPETKGRSLEQLEKELTN